GPTTDASTLRGTGKKSRKNLFYCHNTTLRKHKKPRKNRKKGSVRGRRRPPLPSRQLGLPEPEYRRGRTPYRRWHPPSWLIPRGSGCDRYGISRSLRVLAARAAGRLG